MFVSTVFAGDLLEEVLRRSRGAWGSGPTDPKEEEVRALRTLIQEELPVTCSFPFLSSLLHLPFLLLFNSSLHFSVGLQL